MEINKVGVLGAGTMGSGIVQVNVEAGLPVVLVDIDGKMLERALNGLDKAWSKAVTKGKITEDDKKRFLSLVTTNTDLAAMKDCDLVVEAIVEKIEVKKAVFKQLDEACKAETILASNTSALSITEIASATSRAKQVVGMHFFNPVPAMKLVEVIPGAETAEETTSSIMAQCEKIKKQAVMVKEFPGFIVNRLLVPYINEAALAYQEGVAPAEEIDAAMKLGANMPIGPLALCDLIGIDVVLMIMEYFVNEFNDSKYRPALALKQKVRAGHLGRKTGKGFFDYNK